MKRYKKATTGSLDSAPNEEKLPKAGVLMLSNIDYGYKRIVAMSHVNCKIELGIAEAEGTPYPGIGDGTLLDNYRFRDIQNHPL